MIEADPTVKYVSKSLYATSSPASDNPVGAQKWASLPRTLYYALGGLGLSNCGDAVFRQVANETSPVTADCQFAPLVAISIRVNGEQ